MFESSIVEANSTLQEISAILADIQDEFVEFATKLKASEYAAKELQSNRRGQNLRKLIFVRELHSTALEFTEGVEVVSLGLRNQRERLIQSVGDILLSLEIENSNERYQFASFLQMVLDTIDAINSLLEINLKSKQLLEGTNIFPESNIDSLRIVNQNINLIQSVLNRICILGAVLLK